MFSPTDRSGYIHRTLPHLNGPMQEADVSMELIGRDASTPCRIYCAMMDWMTLERIRARTSKKIGTHTPRLAKYKDQYGGPRCNWAIHHHRYVQSGNGECAIAAAARTFVSHEIQSVRRGRFFFFLPKRDWRGPTAKMDECYFTIIVVWQRWTTPLFIYLTSRSSKYKMSSACVFQFLSERLSTRPECYFSIVEQTTRKRDEIIKYDDSPVGPSIFSIFLFRFPASVVCLFSFCPSGKIRQHWHCVVDFEPEPLQCA